MTTPSSRSAPLPAPRRPMSSSRLSSLALAAAMLVATPAAFATSVVLTPAGASTFAGTVMQAANGIVIDDFSVSAVPFASTFSVTLSSLSGPVTFFTAALFPDTPGEIDFANLTNAVGGDFGFAAPIAAGTPVTLRVFGAVTDAMGNLGGDGAYRVSVLAAVPEPTTVALLLGGLGVIGYTARRRRARSAG